MKTKRSNAVEDKHYFCNKCNKDSTEEVCQTCSKLCWVKPHHWKLKWRTTPKIYGALQKYANENWFESIENDPVLPKRTNTNHDHVHPVPEPKWQETKVEINGQDFGAKKTVAGPGCTALVIESVFPMPRKSFVQAVQDGDISDEQLKKMAEGRATAPQDSLADTLHERSEPEPTVETSEPETSPEAPQTQETADFTVSPGTREGYIQLHFDSKPDADIRRRLMAAGYRWSPKNKVWYGKSLDLPLYHKGHIYRDGYEMKEPLKNIPQNIPDVTTGLIRKKPKGLRINFIENGYVIVHEASGMDIGFPPFAKYPEAFETMDKVYELADWTQPAEVVMALPGMADKLSDLLPPEMEQKLEEAEVVPAKVVTVDFAKSARDRLLAKARGILRCPQ